MDKWMVCIVGIIAGVSLGIAISVLLRQNQAQLPSESGVMYTYDAQNRLQTVAPMGNLVRLKPVEE